jgi:hypothetical protein
LLIESVLADIRARQHRFSDDEHEAAFDVIARFHAIEHSEDVRAIARMRFDEPAGSWANIVAVSAALQTLATLRDQHAVDLNVSRISSDPLRGFVILNLTQLEAWDVTPQIESELLKMRMDNGNGREVVSMLRFLEQTPRKTAVTCDAVKRVERVYEDCFQSNARAPYSFCADLVISSAMLSQACRSSGQPQALD